MTMRLSATGPGINIQYAYRDNKTEYVNDAGKNVARKTPPEMLERFFFSRQLKTLSDLLVSARILGHSPKPQPKFLKIKDIKIEEDPNVKLDHIGTDVTIAITQAAQAQQLNSAPGLWVDQTGYAIRRIRFAPGVEMNGLATTPLSQGLILPKERVVTWPAGSAEIRLVRANSLSKITDSDIPSLSSNSFGTSALSVTLKEFYTRFR
jgi:hypothetical protein